MTLYSSAPRHVLSHPALGIESDTACASIQKTVSGRRSRSRRRPRQWRDCLSVLESFPGWGRDGAPVLAPLMGSAGPHAGFRRPVSILAPMGMTAWPLTRVMVFGRGTRPGSPGQPTWRRGEPCLAKGRRAKRTVASFVRPERRREHAPLCRVMPKRNS